MTNVFVVGRVYRCTLSCSTWFTEGGTYNCENFNGNIALRDNVGDLIYVIYLKSHFESVNTSQSMDDLL